MPQGSVGRFILILSFVGLFPVDASAQSGTAVVRVVAQSPAVGGIQFTGTPSGSVAAGGTLTAPSLSPGSYTTTAAGASQLVSVTCDDAASGTPSVGNMATRSATYNIEAGETVTCTFTYGPPQSQQTEEEAPTAEAPPEGVNPFETPDEGFEDFPLPGDLPPNAGTFRAPKAGPWNVSNHLGEMACTGFVAPLTPSQDSGTLEVNDDGSTVVGRGFSASTATITMHAVSPINGRYQGSFGGSQDGIPMTMNFFWQLVTDEWIVGYLTSTYSASGMTCRIFRTYDLRYAGG